MSQSKHPGEFRDPIVEEVRAVREAIDEEVGHDVAKLAERAKKIGQEYRRKVGCDVAEVPSEATSLEREH